MTDMLDLALIVREVWGFQLKHNVGDRVCIIATDREFTIAGIDDDCYLDAETGAWYHIDDIVTME